MLCCLYIVNALLGFCYFDACGKGVCAHRKCRKRTKDTTNYPFYISLTLFRTCVLFHNYIKIATNFQA